MSGRFILLFLLPLLLDQLFAAAAPGAPGNMQIEVFPVQPVDCLFENDTCSSSCADSSRRCSVLRTNNHSLCFGVPREYPVSNQSLVTGMANLQAWEAAFSNLADCWSKLKPFLCELYEPRCLRNNYRLAPNRKFCKYLSKSCSLLLTQVFPGVAIDILDCDKYPEERVCSLSNATFSPKEPINYEQLVKHHNQKRKCLHPLVATTSVKVQFAHDEFKGCDLSCLSPLYKDSEYTKMRLILSSFSIILVLLNTLIVVSFIVSWKRCATVPRQTLLFVYLCFLLISCIWLTQVFPSAHFDIVCRRDGTLRTGEPLLNRDQDSVSCVVVFVLTQFAGMSSQLSFLLFALTVHAKICRFRRRHFRRLQLPVATADSEHRSRPLNSGNSAATSEEAASPTVAGGDNGLQFLNHNGNVGVGIDGSQNRSSDSSCLIVRPATQWITVIATPIIFLIVALATNEIEGDPISGVCIVSRDNPLARLGLHTCPMLALLLTAVALLCNGYRTLRSLDPHLNRADRQACWSKHVQRWGKGERIMYQSLLYSFGHRALLFAVPATLCCALYLGVDIYAFLYAPAWRRKIYNFVLCQMRREFLQQLRHQQLPVCEVEDPPSYVPLLLQAACHSVLNFAFYLWLPEPLLKGWRDLWHRTLTVCRLRNSGRGSADSVGSHTASEGMQLHQHHQHHSNRSRRQLSQQQSHFYQQLAYLFSDSEKARQQLMRRCQQKKEYCNPTYYQQQQYAASSVQPPTATAPATAASTVVARVGGVGAGGSERTSIGSCSLLSGPVSDTDIYDGQASLPASAGANAATAGGSTAGRAPRHSSLGRDSRRVSGSGRRRRGAGSVAMTTGGHHHRSGSSAQQQQQQQQPEAIYQPGASGQSRVSAQSRASLLTYRSATSERRRQEFEHYLMHYIRPLEYILWQAYQEGFDDALGSGDQQEQQPEVAALKSDQSQSAPQQQQQQQQSRPQGAGFNPQRLLQYNFGFNFPPGSPMMQQHHQQYYQQQEQQQQPAPTPPPLQQQQQHPAQPTPPPPPRLESQEQQQQQQQFFRRLQSRPKATPRQRQSDEFDSEDEECRTPPDYVPAGFLPTGEHDGEDDCNHDDDGDGGEDSDEFDSEAEVNSETEADDVDVVDGDDRVEGVEESAVRGDDAKNPGAVDDVDGEYMVPLLPLKPAAHSTSPSGSTVQQQQQQPVYFLYDTGQP